MSKQTDLVSVSQGSVSGDLSFGDNEKAIFGAGSDLQIYHDGSHSYITDVGTGNLEIRAQNLLLKNSTGTETTAYFDQDGEVGLYYNASRKLNTTATGVDVTGTVTADGLTVEDDLTPEFNFSDSTAYSATNVSPSNALIIYNSDTTTNAFTALQFINGSSSSGVSTINSIKTGTASSALTFNTRNAGNFAERLRISSGGDISFYEDTGTTPKFFWDASAESLGIGTSSPARGLSIHKEGNHLQLTTVASGTAAGNGTDLKVNPSTSDFDILNYESANIALWTNTSERMRIDSSGNVGIGTTSPSEKLHVVRSGAGNVGRFSDGTYGADLAVTSTGGSLQTSNINQTLDFKVYGSGYMRFYGGTSGLSERMRIDSSGNLLVGKTSTDINVDGSRIGGFGAILTRSGNEPLRLNRRTSDGDIIKLDRDGSSVARIGVASNELYIGSITGSDAFLRFGYSTIVPANSSGSNSDNTTDLGSAVSRFDDIYATNGTIQTSDRNEKQDIEALSDAEQRVAVAAKGLLRKYRWKDKVAEKGDAARIHFGIIAQDLQAAFEAEGLDAGRYGMFISSTWTDEETGEERTRLGVRYPELLAFIIAAL